MRTDWFVGRGLWVVGLAAWLAVPVVAQQGDPNGQQQYAQGQDGQQAGDPPERVARLSFVAGNVSLQPAGVDQFSQAEGNYPLTNGDRIYTDQSGRAELESSGLAVRTGHNTDVTVSGLTDQAAQFGLAAGSLRVRSYGLPPSGYVEIDTPNGAVTMVRPGDIRVDTFPQDDVTVVTVTSGEVQLAGAGLNQDVGGGQTVRLVGSNPVNLQAGAPMQPDDLDRFDMDRDAMRAQAAMLIRDQYVNADMIGYDDLYAYGDWAASPDYGQVWYPRSVAADWRPYANGHWAWVAPWGWTWVEAEPWGFAPFHYGRWANFGGRWGWVPGPPVVRPVYSPALVAFVGGPNFSISVGFGGGPGAGVTAWFPLGPREAYVPWYHASPGYVNRVNVTNIYNRNFGEVRNVYNNRTTNVYVNERTVNNVYVNRGLATTAVPQRAFAAGRPVMGSAIRVDPRQMSQAEVLPHPLVTPTREIVAPMPARAVPVNTARPVMRPAPVAAVTPAVIETPPQAPRNNMRFPQGNAPEVQPQRAPATSAVAPAAQRPATAPAQVRPVDQPRPLVNRAEPPAPQPRFEVQQREIERNDPGRPLGPAQTQNVREGRQAGPPQQVENHPHPAPAPAAQKPNAAAPAQPGRPAEH